MAIEEIVKGSRWQEGNTWLIQSIDPMLLFILETKSIHLQDGVG